MKFDKGKTSYLLIGIFVGLVMVFPAQAASPSIKGYIKNLKKWVSKTFITKKDANKKFGSSPPVFFENLLASYLKISDASANYLSKTDAANGYYSKAQSDGNYYNKSQVYTKTESDGTYYDKTTADGRYVNSNGDTMTGNLTAGDFTYSSFQARYLMLPPAGFRPGGDLEVDTVNYGGTIYKSGGTYTNIYAPVSLPNGAVIKKVRMYYYDTKTGDDKIYSALFRSDLDAGGDYYVSISLQSPDGTPGFGNTEGSINEVVNNDQSMYFASVNISNTSSGAGQTLGFRGMRIEYTVNNP